MARTIFVTGGTSALYDKSNWKDLSGLKEKTELFNTLEQEGEESELYNNLYNNALQILKADLETYLTTKQSRHLKNISAEIASMLKFQDSYGKLSSEDTIHILHSDTVEGKLCAEINSDVVKLKLNNKKDVWSVNIHKINSLKIENIHVFQQGLENLKKLVSKLILREDEAKFMNITAGYKGLLPYATILGWDYGMEVLYLFEESLEILRIKTPTNWKPVFDRLF